MGIKKKQCTNLSPVNGIMTCAWEENTIKDNLILGLLKGEREEKNNSLDKWNVHMHSIPFMYSFITIVFIL